MASLHSQSVSDTYNIRSESSYIDRSKNIRTPPSKNKPPFQQSISYPSLGAMGMHVPPEQNATPISVISTVSLPAYGYSSDIDRTDSAYL